MVNKQLSYAPAELSLEYTGNFYYSERLMQDILPRQIALLCYELPKTTEELAEALQTSEVFIKDFAEEMCKLNLMKKIDLEYSTNFPVFHQYACEKVRLIKNKVLWDLRFPQRLHEMIMNKKEEILALDFYGNQFSINYLNWFLYAVQSRLIFKKLTSYYTASKIDEIILGSEDFSGKYNSSQMMRYRFADETPVQSPEDKTIKFYSYFANDIGDIIFYNYADFEPFPVSFDKNTSIFSLHKGRGSYLNRENIFAYMKLVEDPEFGFSDDGKKYAEEFIKSGVAVLENGKYKPMIPVFTQEVYDQLENLFSKDLNPFVQEIIDNIGTKAEEILLPKLHNDKERINQFYAYFFARFLTPINEQIWYGMNESGFEIPADYGKSVAGIFLIK